MVKTKRKGGIRKGAGRKGFSEENKARELVNLGADICIKALKRQGEFECLEISVLLDLARTFAVKVIPQKIEGEFTDNRQIVQVYLPALTSSNANNNRSLETSSGSSRELPSSD